jgi:oligoendopeptidase F
MDDMGALSYRVWYFAALHYDEDQRDNDINARRQQVQILFARQQQSSSWFNPELLAIPFETIRGWLDARADLSMYRFAIESLFHEQEHVLDKDGERLLSFAGRFNSVPHDSYAALTTADMKFPSITMSTGEHVTLSYGQYRAILETNRHQDDRAAAYRTFHGAYAANQNTYAALYNGVLQRDWFHARARSYGSTLDAALHGNNIPPAVVENLIAVTRHGVEPLRRYHRLRRRVLGVDTYKLFDVFVPLVEHDVRYPYDEVGTWIVESVAPLGPEYQREVRRSLEERWIDVFENAGKRHGAYSAPVYGAHPYMLLNYNETLDAVFTLAHEIGHSMHTLLAHRTQPFVYAGYTIFVAEVPSTLNEALFLDFMLERASSRAERTLLLQHAIDSIAGTFYTQVLFADFELQAHRLVEQDRPVTAETLNDAFRSLVRDYYGDAIDEEAVSAVTWARIPHFFSTPYYVYQYATCFASTARLMQDIRETMPSPGTCRCCAQEAATTQ